MSVNRSLTMNSEDEKVYRLEGKTMKLGTSVYSIRRTHGSRPKKRRTKRESRETDAARYVGTTPDPAPDPAPDINVASVSFSLLQSFIFLILSQNPFIILFSWCCLNLDSVKPSKWDCIHHISRESHWTWLWPSAWHTSRRVDVVMKLMAHLTVSVNDHLNPNYKSLLKMVLAAPRLALRLTG